MTFKVPDHMSGVTSDSRQVKPGFVFVAIRGGTQDGHAFIAKAIQDGACMIVGEDPNPAGMPSECGVPYVQVADSRKALSEIASAFYGNPSRSMLMVGVTGTSGKTTTTYLIESILEKAGHVVGVIGTVNFRYGGRILDSTHTTPGAVELQKLLAEMRGAGCTAVVMEVSSHALKQHRVASIAFDGMVFTNLSPEHLDFHPDMEDYFGSKAILFTELADFAAGHGKKPVAAVNADDEWGGKLIRLLEGHPIGVRPFHFTDRLVTDLGGVRGEVDSIPIRSPLTGRFNAYNVLAAVTVARGLGISPQAIASGISSLKAVPGRLERVEDPRGAHGIHILVDYAHKPDALEKVLRTLRDARAGKRLITVFGCGGDRDRKKRPVMGRCAVELSDHVFVTSDNPRTEDPASIIQEILAGIPATGSPGTRNFEVEPDRREAIFKAIRMAGVGDIVLIAGKGHEDYQIIADPKAPGGTRKIHFDDREVAREAVTEISGGAVK